MSTAVLAPPKQGRRGPPRGSLYVPASPKDQPPKSARIVKDRRARGVEKTSRARTVYLTGEVKVQAQQKATKADTSLAVYTREAWDRFLAGKLIPQPPLRAVRNSGIVKEKFVQWEEDEYWAQLTSRCQQATEELGFRVNPSSIAEQHLRALTGLENPARE
ncbi:hypothetical protein OG618_37435 (plasmid) [Kitasatospora sp. NBC_01246]|uniref:hypothetical protein n=1 Tax=Kitasatospora sp. NBC_01246 TaxID=2903570 RepID=UPI002E37380D|nr:hypothetical protein [Kitasatospora sp. NBC_01246]